MASILRENGIALRIGQGIVVDGETEYRNKVLVGKLLAGVP